MRAQFVIPVLASILILGTLVAGLTPSAYAQPEEKLVIVFLTDQNGKRVENALCCIGSIFCGNIEDIGLTNRGGIIVLSIPANFDSTDVTCFVSPNFSAFLLDVSLNQIRPTFIPLTIVIS